MRMLALGLSLALGTVSVGATPASAGGWNDDCCYDSHRYYAPPVASGYYAAPPAYVYFAPPVVTYYAPPPVYAYAPPPLRYFRPYDYRPAYRDHGYVGWRRW
jgi:hypothetical protein